MPRPTAVTRPTELGVFVKRLRGQLGLSQLELVDRLNEVISEVGGQALPRKYASLVETGARRSLDEHFYQALSTLSGQPIEKLKDLQLLRTPHRIAAESTQPKDRLSTRRVRLGCGHVVWCAPIIAAALEGRLPDLEIATFANADPNNDQPSIDRAVWIRSNAWPVLPKDLEELAGTTPGPTPSGREPKTTIPLSANDVLRWLSEEAIDIAAVPGDLVKENRDLMRVGRLVDSAAGCILVCDAPLAAAIASHAPGDHTRWHAHFETADRAVHRPHINTEELLAALLKCRSELRGKRDVTLKDPATKDTPVIPRIAAEAGTIGMSVLEAALASPTSEKKPNLLDIAYDLPARLLAKSAYAAIDRELGFSLAGAITWEPHAHWLVRNSNVTTSSDGFENSLDCFPVALSPNELGRPRHLEYDLVILRKNSGNPLLKRVIYDLLWKTWQAAQEIEQIRPGAFHKHLRPLAAYFNLGEWNKVSRMSEVVAQVVGGVRFAVSLDIENQHEFMSGNR